MNYDAFRAALVGQVVHRLVAQEYCHAGQLSDRFNVLFALAGDRWLRFFFDAGVFFCSVAPAPNPPWVSGDHEGRLSEHPFTGTVQEVMFSSLAGAVSLRIVLSDGRT